MEKKYPITPSVKRLFADDKNQCIFHKENKYVIPRYQRPYSWEEEQISEFLETLLDGFDPDDTTIKPEQVFFGTMQFNLKEAKKDCNQDKTKDIVDGQQRMTTFVLFLSLLKHISGDSLPCFEEKINIQNESINGILREDSIRQSLLEVKPKVKKGSHVIEEKEKKYSLYEKNFILLNSILLEYYKEYQNNRKESNETCITFTEYLKTLFDYRINYVYFVVMKTEDEQMTLSEIVKVFNTINTTGMDLNAADIFKLMFFDYHKMLENSIDDDQLLSRIDDIFKLVEDKNELKMTDVLDIYKHILCTAPEKALGFKTLKMSNEAFFEYLFKQQNLREELKDYLSLESFEKLVRLTVGLYDYSHKEADKGISSLAELIISETRYSRYWTLPYVYTFFNFKLKDKKLNEKIDEISRNDDNPLIIYNSALEKVFIAAKYFIVYSVVNDKVINVVQNKICGEFMPSFKNDVSCELTIDDATKKEFCKRIKENLKENDKRAYIVCLISAIIDEVNEKNECAKIRKKLFSWKDNPYDIEHIEAKKNWAALELKETDKLLYNGIGNLVVLERKINRSIQDEQVVKKVVSYDKYSDFVSVKNVCKLFNDSNNEWKKIQVEKRCEDETDKLTKFLFNN